MIVLLDLHVHSRASYDSILSPRMISQIAKYRGLDGYSLTDHDTIENLEEAEYYAQKNGLVFIPGIEKKTDKGDILALFITENITSSNFEDAINEIRSKNGLAILPHPLKSHEKVTKADWAKFDAIEVLNGRCSDEKNTESESKISGLPHVGGSDAHTWWEIGNVCTQFCLDNNQAICDESIRRTIVDGKVTPLRKKIFSYHRNLWTVRYSEMIKAVKNGRLVEHSMNLARRTFRRI